MSISDKIFLGFALIILFSVAGFIVNYKLSKEVERNMGFVSASESVIRNSTQLHKSIIEIQSASRGFLITGNSTFLLPFQQGVITTPRLIRELQTQVRSSKTQTRNMDSVRLYHHQWIEYVQRLIYLKKGSATPKGMARYNQMLNNRFQKGEGTKLVEKIKIKFNVFDKNEYTLRAWRREQLKASINHTNLITAIILLVNCFFALLIGYLIANTISYRISELAAFAGKIAKGEFERKEDKTKDELQALTHSLNTMSERLERNFADLQKSNDELDQFAYVASHDLKAPLRGMYHILLWIEEDLDARLPEEVKAYHSKLKGRIVRLENLINGLLEYARIGKTTTTTESFEIKKTIDEIVDMIVPGTFHVSVKCETQWITGEKTRLEQVLTNIISNAVRYQYSDRGVIEITCESKEEVLEFSIRDEGVGIAPLYHEKIFALFQTLREKHETESTGIGLSIVKKILDEQNGSIKVESEQGKGSVFIFTWPKNAQ